MLSAKVVMDGNSQAVRIHKALRLNSREVWIERLPDGSLLIKEKRPLPAGCSNIFEHLIRNAPARPLSGFTELCETRPELDLPEKVF